MKREENSEYGQGTLLSLSTADRKHKCQTHLLITKNKRFSVLYLISFLKVQKFHSVGQISSSLTDENLKARLAGGPYGHCKGLPAGSIYIPPISSLIIHSVTPTSKL